MALSSALWLVQLASTLPLVGLIWTIQIVHYPLFDAVRADTFVRFHRAHSTRISLIVMPLMVVELVSSMASAMIMREAVTWVGFSLVIAVWVATFLLSVPMHDRLAVGFEARSHHTLVVTNWVRTVAWTARGLLLVAMIARMMP